MNGVEKNPFQYIRVIRQALLCNGLVVNLVCVLQGLRCCLNSRDHVLVLRVTNGKTGKVVFEKELIEELKKLRVES